MNITKAIKEKWTPENGLCLAVRYKKGYLIDISVPRRNKWDVWGWKRGGRPAVVVRGEGRVKADYQKNDYTPTGETVIDFLDKCTEI